MAIMPDLDAEGLEDVSCVTVILAYNKDDEQNGIELYDRFVSDAPSTLRDVISLRFVRWNLSDLVEQTILHVLSPSLLPEHFFGQLSYLSAQVSDFRHGSDEWERQLVPNWRRSADDLLRESGSSRSGADPSGADHIAPAQCRRIQNSLETGWIDLVEWAAIALWDYHAQHSDAGVLRAIQRFWTDFYIGELDRFYRSYIEDLSTEQSIDQMGNGSYVGAVAASYVAYWHLGRLGLLSVEIAGSQNDGDPTRQQMRGDRLHEIANWTALLANGNVSVFRPVLDIQHIEFFLLTEVWRNAGRGAETAALMENLLSRLYLRRLGQSDLPFLDGTNSFDNVFEELATRPVSSLGT